MQKHDKVASKISLIKLPLNTKFEFELGMETDWVRDMLIELNENASEKTPEEYLQETSLYVYGEMEKKDKPEMGEFLTIKGTIQADYVTECVRTLQPMTIELDVPFKVCFIDEELATSELFTDQDDTYVEGEVYELYFYKKRTIEFQDMVHEQLFLHYNQYPVLDAESTLPGLTESLSEEN
jgi:hypothetical protein